MRERLEEQFRLRSAGFDGSANWITEPSLLRHHVELAGKPAGRALELCCGTGQVGRALAAAGWEVNGLDLSPEMAAISGKYFPVSLGRAEAMPFPDASFGLVVCRQSFQFLEARDALAEITRVLRPGGRFVVSLTVPFSEADSRWLGVVHRIKQPLLKVFYTRESLLSALREAGFSLEETRTMTVRESVTRWMRCAPELSPGTRARVIRSVKDSPPEYRKARNVEERGGEVFEDWNWMITRLSRRGG